MRRELGEGRWDKILMRRMTELSVADNYNDAKKEWMATGRVWWRGNGEIPNWVTNSKNGEGKCLCGHPIVYHFEITNTENDVVECVGSDHINSYLIMRQIADEMGLDPALVTDAQVEKWISERVTSMKAEAWWAENGESFAMMFDKVKEIDVRYNTRAGKKGDYYWDKETENYVRPRRLRKMSKGKFGEPNYKMASIVWRWNHPDNPKNQMKTKGFPNKRLMQDLSLYFVLSEPLIEKLEKEKQQRQLRISEVQERKALQAEERRLRGLRQGIATDIYRATNIVNNAEKIALNKAIKYQSEEYEDWKTKQRRKMEEERRKENQRLLNENNEDFINMCQFYGIPVFDDSFATNDWSRNFLTSIKLLLSRRRPLTSSQMHTLKNILTAQPTDKQIQYLRDLGYEGEIPTKTFASNQIAKILAEKGDGGEP